MFFSFDRFYMNGNECVGTESLFEPAFDIDGQLMGAEHAHPRIDADMGFDGDGGSDTACAQMVRFGHLLRVSQDVQYLLLGCGGRACSSSSPRPLRSRSNAILKMKTETTRAASGSAMRHLSPRK